MAFLKLELLTFFNMLLLGIGIGIIFDLYRVLRWKIRVKRLFTDLGDLLFSLLITLITFIILIYSNGGEVRLYIFLGIISGQLIYYSTLSVFMINFYRGTLNFINYIFNRLKNIAFFLGRQIRFGYLNIKKCLTKVFRR
ncbi:spore cortex biosynthesis protein YabQ [Halonatronum saccharophilum]|uniref:spore cortex biosynthesis protein YabQ n=1 Tax=Halonatronum saccharophilum TaxID=150060 RepID=UPI0004854EF1